MVHPKAQPVRYDYVRHLKEEFAALEAELAEPGVEQGLADICQRFQVPREWALAAVHRAAKRNGYTVKVFLEQLKQQLETEQRGPAVKPK